MRVVVIILALLYSIIGFSQRQGFGIIQAECNCGLDPDKATLNFVNPFGTPNSTHYAKKGYDLTSKTFWSWDGTEWERDPTAATGNYWSLGGNTTSQGDFVGSTNDVLTLKSFNNEAMSFETNTASNFIYLPPLDNNIVVKPTNGIGKNLRISSGFGTLQAGILQLGTTTSLGNSDIEFYTNVNSINKNSMKLSGENLGINEQSPTANLHVNGTVRIDQAAKNGQNKVLTCLDNSGNGEWKEISTVLYNQYDVVNSDVVQVVSALDGLEDSKQIGIYYPIRVKGANTVCVTGFANSGTAAAGNITVKIQTGLGSFTKTSFANGDINSFCYGLDPNDSLFTVEVNTLTGVTNLKGFSINIYQIN